MDLKPGTALGPYRIVEPLGVGGMAAVFRAYEAGLDRHVAVKVLPREFLHEETFAERFRREAKVVARLEHPNIIPVHAFGIDDGIPWMAMRLVSGGSLHGLLQNGPLEAQRAADILSGVAEALDYAHENGVVHRDVKPQNILLDSGGRVYLADFGVARMAQSSTVLTREGVLAGTPQYMAPELARGEAADHRVDIYSLGVVAYQAFTGKVPFQADTPVVVLMKHVMDPVPSPEADGIPAPVSRALVKCLAKQPDDRWPTAGSFARALSDGVRAGSRGGGTRDEKTTAAIPALAAAAPGTPVLFAPDAPPTSVQTPALPRAPGSPVRWVAVAAWVVVAAGVLVWSRRAAGPGAAATPTEAPLPLAPVSSSPSGVVSSAPGSVVTRAPSTPAATPARKVAKPPANPAAGDLYSAGIDGLEYVFVPPAPRFKRGCVPRDEDCYPDERPRHDVVLSRGYWLGKTEVTVAAFERFVQATRGSMPPAPTFNPEWGMTDHPVVNVSYADAAAYCGWAGGRLPTEAEWEHAARGGRPEIRFPWGSQPPVCREGAQNGARYDDREGCGQETTQPVASYGANGFGLFDLAGNVWEWCADWYDAKAYARAARKDPAGPNDGSERVLRGGSLNSRAKGLRVSLRNRLAPGARSKFVGVRCVLPAE